MKKVLVNGRDVVVHYDCDAFSDGAVTNLNGNVVGSIDKLFPLVVGTDYSEAEA